MVADAVGSLWRTAVAHRSERDAGPFGGIVVTAPILPYVRADAHLSSELLALRRLFISPHATETPIVGLLREPSNSRWAGLTWAYDLGETPSEAERASPLAGYLFGPGYGAASIRLDPHVVAWARFISYLPPLDVVATPFTTGPAQADVRALPAETGRINEAVSNLRLWLGMTPESIALATGIALRSLRYWQAGAVRPRARTARPLWRLSAVASALHGLLAPEQLQQWLATGDPSPMDELAAGDLAAFEARAKGVLFRDARVTRRLSGLTLEDVIVGPRSTAQVQYRRAARKTVRSP